VGRLPFQIPLGWLKTKNLKAPGFICVQSWDEARKEMLGFATTQADYPITGTTEWTEVKTILSVPEGTAMVVVRAGIAAPENNGGKIWIDDITIEKEPSPGS
jgi:hypothetical protein